MRKLKVTRYKQKPAHCAIAACASIINYYDKEIDYKKTQVITKKSIVKKLNQGLNSGEIGRLLNILGFHKVDIISTNLLYLDYSWSKLKKPSFLKKLGEMAKEYEGEYRDDCKALYKWLKTTEYDNNLIIDYDFGKYIRNSLDDRKPLIFTFNWSMFFRHPKTIAKDIPDFIKGECDEHAVVACGYDKYGVDICDSHHQFYKYGLKKYRCGAYRISWENLMSIIGWGDVILVDGYKK